MVNVKYKIILIMICFFLSVSDKGSAYSEMDYIVRINEFDLELDYEVILVEKEPYIPIREVIEFLGGNVCWFADSKSVEIKYDTQKLKFTPGEKTMLINGEFSETGKISFLCHDKTYISCRVLCELFSFSYSHIEFNKTIYFGVKMEDVRRNCIIEYFVYDFPLPTTPTNYSITIRTDGVCVLSYGKEYPETLIYPKAELLQYISSMIENETFLSYEKDENEEHRTDEKKIMLKICSGETEIEYFVSDNIGFLDSLFGERIGKYLF